MLHHVRLQPQVKHFEVQQLEKRQELERQEQEIKRKRELQEARDAEAAANLEAQLSKEAEDDLGQDRRHDFDGEPRVQEVPTFLPNLFMVSFPACHPGFGCSSSTCP